MIVPGRDGQSLEVMAITLADEQLDVVSIVIHDNKTGQAVGSIFVDADVAEALQHAVKAARLIAQAGNLGGSKVGS